MSYAALIGAGLGLLSSKGGSETEKREPWAPVQPWLKNLIVQGQDLQDQYLRQPFSPSQQQSLNNKIGDSNMFRRQMAPQMFGVANQLMRPMSRPAMNRTPGQYAQRGYTPTAPTPVDFGGLLDVPQIDFGAGPQVSQSNADLNKLIEELKKQYYSGGGGDFDGGGGYGYDSVTGQNMGIPGYTGAYDEAGLGSYGLGGTATGGGEASDAGVSGANSESSHDADGNNGW